MTYTIDKPLNKRMRARLVRDAQVFLEEHVAIDWTQYSEPVIEYGATGVTCDITWSRLSNGATIGIGNIYYADDGSILQAGTNYGRLSL